MCSRSSVSSVLASRFTSTLPKCNRERGHDHVAANISPTMMKPAVLMLKLAKKLKNGSLKFSSLAEQAYPLDGAE